MTDQSISRRGFLFKTGLVGCSLAASPFVTPISLASAPTDNRLVVIILRGGMDGLDVVRPVGDPAFRDLRPRLSPSSNGLPLDGFFSLHSNLGNLLPLWSAGELAFAHAVSTPYRDKRSHFDGQDMLEAGIGPGSRVNDGWLNRALQHINSTGLETAFSVGRERLLVLSGDAQVAQWAPGYDLALSSQAKNLLGLIYKDTPLFDASLAQALSLAENLGSSAPVDDFGDMREAMMETMQASKGASGIEQIADFTANRLLNETRIAAFSIGGWDTHINQKNTLSRPLSDLQIAILTMKDKLGPIWEKTAIVAMTEFGRTARENGSGGTDHGTGGVMVMAGGTIKGGKVYGAWPGLGASDLYQGRDLLPTADVRSYTGALLSGLFGLSGHDLETHVFPGVEMAGAPSVLR